MPQTKTKSLSQNGTAGFLFAPEWVWVDYPALELVGDDLGDDERYHGFKVEVLASLNGFKAREHDVALREYVAATRTAVEANDLPAVDAAEDRYLAAIAWRVRAWNFREANILGEVVDVPAPGAGGEEGYLAFFVLPSALRAWTVRVVREAVRPKRTIPRSSPAGTTGGPTPPPITLEPTPPPS
jgi:hypothetical protein